MRHHASQSVPNIIPDVPSAAQLVLKKAYIIRARPRSLKEIRLIPLRELFSFEQSASLYRNFVRKEKARVFLPQTPPGLSQVETEQHIADTKVNKDIGLSRILTLLGQFEAFANSEK